MNEDLSVTERRSHSGLDRLKRAIRRRWLQGILHTRAQELVATDNAIARKLHEIAQDLSNFHLEGPDGNTDFSGDPNHPKIMGPAKPLGPIEQEDYDLGYTFLDENGNPLPMLDENGNVVIDPKTGRPVPDSVWGDPADNNADGSPRVPHPPRDHHFADMDANDPYRTLPTGTTVGPNGERIALVSRPPDDPAWAENQTKNGKSVYVTQTEAYDVTRQPPQSLGKLQGVDGSKVYQGSIVYDKASGRMYVVGNHGDGSGDTARGMWRSDPVDPNHPNDWVKTLRYQGDVVCRDRVRAVWSRCSMAALRCLEPTTIAQRKAAIWPSVQLARQLPRVCCRPGQSRTYCLPGRLRGPEARLTQPFRPGFTGIQRFTPMS